MDPEHVGRRMHLPHPALGERLPLGEDAVGHLPHLAPGGKHEHDAVAGLDQRDHRAARRDRLVVGVGVEEDDRGRPPIVPSRTDAGRPPARKPRTAARSP